MNHESYRTYISPEGEIVEQYCGSLSMEMYSFFWKYERKLYEEGRSTKLNYELKKGIHDAVLVFRDALPN